MNRENIIELEKVKYEKCEACGCHEMVALQMQNKDRVFRFCTKHRKIFGYTGYTLIRRKNRKKRIY